MAKLDIIVTHYDEPFSVGKKFFDMLAMQRGVDFSEINVMLLHDGTDPFDQEMFSGYPYTVTQYKRSHGGIAALRNGGIRLAESEWLCFCDFDDMFANVYSLRHVLTLLPNDNYDVLWGKFYAEDVLADGRTRLNLRGQNSVFIHAKFFRTAFLLENELTFPEDLEFNEDSAFCAITFAVCDYRRVGEITAETPLYVWTYREGSATGTQQNRWKGYRGMYFRNKKVCDVFRERMPEERYRGMVCRTCYDAYNMLNVKELPEDMVDILDDFKAFWKAEKDNFLQCGRELRMETARVSEAERKIGDREEMERWQHTDREFNEGVTFGEWIRMKVEA